MPHARARAPLDPRLSRCAARTIPASLTEDAVALLEWLEARLAQRATPLRVDANDRLLDVLDRLAELVRLTDAPCVDGGRRAEHLVRSVEVELDTIARGLVGLHAEMRRFAGRTFEPLALERVVSGLEDAAGFLRNVGERRRELDETIARLASTETYGRLTTLYDIGGWR